MGTKRINLTVSEQLHGDLSKWAGHQGRPVANLSAFLLERQVADAKRTGEFPDDDAGKQSINFLKSLFVGGFPKNGEIVRLAHQLGVSEEFLESIRDLYLEGRNAESLKR